MTGVADLLKRMKEDEILIGGVRIGMMIHAQSQMTRYAPSNLARFCKLNALNPRAVKGVTKRSRLESQHQLSHALWINRLLLHLRLAPRQIPLVDVL